MGNEIFLGGGGGGGLDMPCIIPVFLNHWSFLQIVGILWHDERGGGSGPLVCAKGRTAWRARPGTTCPVSSLIGSPNHSKKLPVLILFISVGCFMNCISI